MNVLDFKPEGTPKKIVIKQAMSADAVRLLTMCHRGGDQLCFFVGETKSHTFFDHKDIKNVALPANRDIYFSVHPTSKAKRRTKENVVAINVFFADMDKKDFSNDWSKLDAHVASLPIPPSVKVKSGNGYHCYWFFSETVKIDNTNREKWSKLQAQWVDFVGGDKGCKDIARILRVPNTLNCKNGEEKQVLVVASSTWTQYDANDLIAAMGHKINESVSFAVPDIGNEDVSFYDIATTPDVVIEPPQRPNGGDAGAAKLIDNAIAEMRSAKNGTRNGTLNKAAFTVAGVAQRVSADYMQRRCDELKAAARAVGLDDDEIETTFQSGYAKGLQQPLPDHPAKKTAKTAKKTAASGRAKIIVNDKQLPDLGKECIDALIKLNAIFTRNGLLVIVKIDEKNSPTIVILTIDALKALLAQSADFYIEVADKNFTTEVAVYPPNEVVKYILNAHNNIFPPLAGIIESPIMRRDGTILDQAGYDVKTGLFYHPQDDLKMMLLEDQTQQTAQIYYELLCELVSDFPFASDADRDNFIATMIAQFVGDFFDIQPICAFSAPQQSTGKTLCASVGAAISAGRPPSMGAVPTTDEEWQKRITTNVIGGKNIHFYDNAISVVENAALAGLVTTGIWEDRLLGGNTKIVMPTRAQIIITGNNLRFGGDMITRIMAIRLDAKMAKPQERDDFKYPDILNHVLENRGLYVTAILGMCKAWYDAGRPKPVLAPKCRFIKWREVVGGILEFAGAKSFLGNMREVYASADDDGPVWEAFIIAMNRVFGKSAVTSGMIFSRCVDSDELTAIVPEPLLEHLNEKGKGKFAQRLGYELKSRKEKRFGDSGAYVTSAPTSATSPVKMWIFCA